MECPTCGKENDARALFCDECGNVFSVKQTATEYLLEPKRDPTLRVIFWITSVLGALPFLVYGWARLFGSIPSEEEWDRTSTNHGPWYATIEGMIVGYPLILLLFLPLVTFFVMIGLSMSDRKIKTFFKGLLLIALQIALIFGQGYIVWWTVD